MINRRGLLIAAGALLISPWIGRRALAAGTEAETAHAVATGRGSTSPVIRVVGVGGGGCDIVERVQREGMAEVDRTVLIDRSTERRLLDVRLGSEVDRELTRADTAAIWNVLQGTDIVFLVAGLGGITATRVAPQVAKLARAAGAVVVAVVTLPFALEGRRSDVAARGMRLMTESSDKVIGFSNEEYLQRAQDGVPILSVYDQINDEIALGLRKAISESASAA